MRHGVEKARHTGLGFDRAGQRVGLLLLGDLAAAGPVSHVLQVVVAAPARKQLGSRDADQVAVSQGHRLAHVGVLVNAVKAQQTALHREAQHMNAAIDIGDQGLEGAESHHVQPVKDLPHHQRRLACLQAPALKNFRLLLDLKRAVVAQQFLQFLQRRPTLIGGKLQGLAARSRLPLRSGRQGLNIHHGKPLCYFGRWLRPTGNTAILACNFRPHPAYRL